MPASNFKSAKNHAILIFTIESAQFPLPTDALQHLVA